MTARRAALLLVTAGIISSLATEAAGGPAHRTLLLSRPAGGRALDGRVAEPALAGLATAAAYTTTATTLAPPDLNGPIADVVVQELASGIVRRASTAPDGTAADGPSGEPALSRNGLRVAFTSLAGNLVAGDANGVADVFVRDRGGVPIRVSVPSTGGEADGPSFEPDVSADGARVAFTSLATNLVPGDTNGVADIFVRDLARGTTTRISTGPGGRQTGAPSGTPAISGDGRTVAFQSSADDLVPRDTNRVADVFVRSGTRAPERVSVSTTGKQQDRAVASPFRMTPDISQDGRYVVFDTDATTLYANDRNEHTDVYLRDRRLRTTTLVSANSLNVQGNNDSVTPRLSAGGRFVSFQSFATNLVPDDGPREDLFVRDLLKRTTTIVNATDSGRRRAAEPSQLLQRAPVSDDGRTALFLSAARGITADAPTGGRRLYLRRLDPPTIRLRRPVVRGRSVVIVRVQSDDPDARRYLCRIDRARPFYCPATIVVPARAGRVLAVRNGGAGMLWSDPQKIRIPAR